MVKMKQTLDAISSAQSSSPPEQHTAEASTKSETKNSVDHPEDGEVLIQNQPIIQKTLPDEKNINPDNTASLAPHASSPPVLADDDSFNTPPYVQTWNPHEEMLRMQQHMERAYNDRYNYPDYNRPDYRYSFKQNISVPEIDVREDRDRYIVLVNIPGADQKDISVNLESQKLTVAGKQEYKNQDRDASGHIIFSERRSGKFKRSITLRAPVEKKGMQTRIDNGVLRIIIPKKK